jgi:hypothetical protein
VTRSDAAAAQRIASLVRACPSVARLSGGRDGTAVTYGPGSPVVGVCFTDRGLELHVVTIWGAAPRYAAAEIREAVRSAWEGQAIDVVIEDIEAPPLAEATAGSER